MMSLRYHTNMYDEMNVSIVPTDSFFPRFMFISRKFDD